MKHREEQNNNFGLGPEPIGAVQTKKRFPRSAIIGIVIAAVVIIAGCVAGYLIYQHNEEVKAFNLLVDQTINVDTYYEGITVQGIDLSGKTKEEAKQLLKELEPQLRDKIDITFTCGDKQYQLTEDDFTFTYGTEEVLEKAYNVARTGERMERYEAVLALKEKPQKFDIQHELQIDEQKLTEFVNQIAEENKVEMVDAAVTGFEPLAAEKFTYAEGTPGREVETEPALAKLKELLAAEDKTGAYEVATKEVPCTTTVEDLKARTVRLSSFSTISTNNANGNTNMRLSLASANGTILQPDEIFSFNETTGDTTTGDLGYLPAGAIAGGKSIQAYGGGICQTSTTIYGAAMRADMDITLRYNHLWPSSYVPIGQDATVDYPGVDFQFRNSSPYPIYIVAWMDGVKLNVEFYGYQPDKWDTIEVNTWQTGTIPQPADEFEVDNSLAPGEKKLDRKGNAGKTAEGERIYYKNGEEVKRDPIHSSYYSEQANKYLVGPDTPTS